MKGNQFTVNKPSMDMNYICTPYSGHRRQTKQDIWPGQYVSERQHTVDGSVFSQLIDLLATTTPCFSYFACRAKSGFEL